MVLNFVLERAGNGVRFRSIDKNRRPICSCHAWAYSRPYPDLPRAHWIRCHLCLEACLAHGSDLDDIYSLSSDIADKVIPFFLLYRAFRERFDGA